MEDDLIIDPTGIYYNISDTTLKLLCDNDTTIKIQYSLIIECSKFRKKIYNVMKTFIMDGGSYMELCDDRIILILFINTSTNTSTNTSKKLYFIRTNINKDSSIEQFRILFLTGYHDLIIEEVLLSVL
jgi:hypothetical protein